MSNKEAVIVWNVNQNQEQRDTVEHFYKILILRITALTH